MTDKSRAVADIPSGLFVVAVKDANTGKIDGFLASWVQQVSFEPLLISLAMKPERNIHNLILDGAAFTLNVVGEKNKEFMKHFWSGYDATKNPFDELGLTEGPDGTVLMKDAKSVMVCKNLNTVTPGDHTLVIAEVTHSFEQDETTQTFIHRRTDGLDY